MSAASPATSQVRRTAAAAPSRSVASEPVRAQPTFAFADGGGDEVKLDLADIPRQQESMDIEGFKPTLLSRLFDLLAPLK